SLRALPCPSFQPASPAPPLPRCHLTSSSVCAQCHRAHPDPHSFPTRRSSDLRAAAASTCWPASTPPCGGSASTMSRPSRRREARSEEHTSELQSRFDLVCRLLLEKKKRRTWRDRGDARPRAGWKLQSGGS